MPLKEQVLNLISLKQEGEYWDFKKQWYSNKSDMLHDIICMANNISDNDGLIIIGVDEEQDYAIVDIDNDLNRRKTQDIVCFLRDKKFAGGIRPTVYVETLNIGVNCIDVIVVKNSNYTPYYLTDSFEGVFANNIYSRIMDTNTPKNKSADINIVEKLWKRRFGIDKTAVDKIHQYIKNVDDWEESEWGGMYYKYDPLFTIVRNFDTDRNGYEFYHFNQMDTRPHFSEIILNYGQTKILSFIGASLDGGRYFTCTPEMCGLSLDPKKHSWDFTYRYYVIGSIEYDLHKFFEGECIDDERIAKEKFMSLIIVFESEIEKEKFNRFILDNHSEYKKEDYFNLLPGFPNLKGYNMEALIDDYVNALMSKDMFRDFKYSKCSK